MSTPRTTFRIATFAFAVGIVLLASSDMAEAEERRKRDVLLSETDDARVGKEAANDHVSEAMS